METSGKKYMNPYLAGFFLGLVILASFFISGQGVGASGAPKRIVASVVVDIAPDYAANNGAYAKYVGHGNPLDNWLVYMVLGVLFGGFLSGAIAGRLKLKVDHSPKITSKTRLLMALAGGTLFGFGASFARGCTSGAGLSAMSSFSISGYIVVGVLFGTSYALAYFFRKFWI